jgi:hypothetical protein
MSSATRAAGLPVAGVRRIDSPVSVQAGHVSLYAACMKWERKQPEVAAIT